MIDKKKSKKDLVETFKEKYHSDNTETIDQTLRLNPSIDRWEWLLYRTLYQNNWSHLHKGFKTDESYLRELANLIDYMKDEANNVQPLNLARQSMLQYQNQLYEFRQNFAVEMYKRHTAKETDALLVQQMVKRTIWAKAYDEELMSLVADSFDRKESEDKVNSLDQAFQLKKLNNGRPEPEYKTPYNIKRLVSMILDEDMSGEKCKAKLDEEANNHLLKTKENKGMWRTANEKSTLSVWTRNKWENQMKKYKFTALNDYLIDSMQKGRVTLDERRRQRIKNNWNKIDIPKKLMVAPTFSQLGIGRLDRKDDKDGKKTVTAEVIKANKNLH